MPFYHEKMLSSNIESNNYKNSDPTTLKLYYHKSSSDTGELIATCPLNGTLIMGSSIDWLSGGDLFSNFSLGVGTGAQSLIEFEKTVSNATKKTLERIFKKNDDGTVSNMKGPLGLKVINPSSGFLQFAESTENISIPSMEIIFPNINDNYDFIVNACKLLVMVLPPVIKGTSGTGLVDQIKLQRPPMGYWNNNESFSESSMHNFFSLKLGVRNKINYLVPDNITVEQSASGSMFSGKWLPHYLKVSISFRRVYKLLTTGIIDSLGGELGIKMKEIDSNLGMGDQLPDPRNYLIPNTKNSTTTETKTSLKE